MMIASNSGRRPLRVAVAHGFEARYYADWAEKFKRGTGAIVVFEGPPRRMGRAEYSTIDAIVYVRQGSSHSEFAAFKRDVSAYDRPLVVVDYSAKTWDVVANLEPRADVDQALLERSRVKAKTGTGAPLTANIFDIAKAKLEISKRAKDAPAPEPTPIPDTGIRVAEAVADEPASKEDPDEAFLREYARRHDAGETQAEIIATIADPPCARTAAALSQHIRVIVGRGDAPAWFVQWWESPESEAAILRNRQRLAEARAKLAARREAEKAAPKPKAARPAKEKPARAKAEKPKAAEPEAAPDAVTGALEVLVKAGKLTLADAFKMVGSK